MTTEETILMPLTLREIAIITALRKIEYGVIEIHKINFTINRVISKTNKLITDEDGLNIVQGNSK